MHEIHDDGGLYDDNNIDADDDEINILHSVTITAYAFTRNMYHVTVLIEISQC